MESGYILLRWRYFRSEYRARVSVKGIRSGCLGHKTRPAFLDIFAHAKGSLYLILASQISVLYTEGKLSSSEGKLSSLLSNNCRTLPLKSELRNDELLKATSSLMLTKGLDSLAQADAAPYITRGL